MTRPRVSIVCSDKNHPVFAYLERWGGYDELVTRTADLSGGDLLFLVSCTEMVRPKTIEMYSSTLVLHASDLPIGRGWSPHIWAIVEGANEVTLSLLEAEEPVDTGDVWAKRVIRFDGTELFDEINAKLFENEIALIEWAITNYETIRPEKQLGSSTYWPRRTPADSEIDGNLPLSEQFDTLRVADPDRYPATVELRGKRFKIRLERIE